ncbi:hypothetical protein FJZ53_06485 [Candidatus Woesearchaeota archaeon]|nr:hypothetical protein [Candidatus Woesearchaeota archaeon]
MDDKTLLKISVICSLIGILIIFIFAEKLEPPTVAISDVNEGLVEKDVKLRGEIYSIRNLKQGVSFRLKDETGFIDVIIFNDESFDVNKGESVEVQGVVKTYNGGLEIEAKEVRALGYGTHD